MVFNCCLLFIFSFFPFAESQLHFCHCSAMLWRWGCSRKTVSRQVGKCLIFLEETARWHVCTKSAKLHSSWSESPSWGWSKGNGRRANPVRSCSRRNPSLPPTQPALSARVDFRLMNAQLSSEFVKGFRVTGNGVNNIKVPVLPHNLLYNRQFTWSF